MKLKKLTVEQATVALTKSPYKCPYCSCTQLEGEGVDIGGNARSAEQEVTCPQCGASFYLRFVIDSTAVINGPTA